MLEIIDFKILSSKLARDNIININWLINGFSSNNLMSYIELDDFTLNEKLREKFTTYDK